MIEISRMRRQAEKVAGLWARHGAMCRLQAPRLALAVAPRAAKAQSTPAAGPLWDGPAPLWGNLGFIHDPSFRSFSLACCRKPRFIEHMRRSLEWLRPASSHSDAAVMPPYRKAGGKLTQMMPQMPPQIPPQFPWGCCKCPAARHRAKGRENPS